MLSQITTKPIEYPLPLGKPSIEILLQEEKQCKTTPIFQISQHLHKFSFLSISAAKYVDKSMKEISITNNNNSNHNTGEETDSYEETPNKKTSGKPFLN